MGVNVAIFGGLDRKPIGPGWTRETVVALLGGAKLDLTESPPGPSARLTAIAILGGVEILVPPGSRVSTSGLSLLGGRSVRVTPGDGPEMRLRLVSFLGGVEVKENGAETPG
ncbi:MAG TPA: hypothetical protein VK915_15000 [Gaiellaceae bacterium]|nr:hypothetical protein [Gaiellaceae bacterium]